MLHADNVFLVIYFHCWIWYSVSACKMNIVRAISVLEQRRASHIGVVGIAVFCCKSPCHLCCLLKLRFFSVLWTSQVNDWRELINSKFETVKLIKVAMWLNIHCVSKKILNIFDCNLKKDYQILIVIGLNISETTCQLITAQFPTSPKVICVLPGEDRINEISLFYSMQYYCLI